MVDRLALIELAPVRALTYIDSGLRDPTMAKWSLTGPSTLAVGSSGGALLLFRRDSRKKVPIVGKAAAAITSGAWSVDGRLAIGSIDGVLSVSTADGDEVDALDLAGPPAGVAFATRAPGEGSAGGVNDTNNTNNNNGAGAATAASNLLAPTASAVVGGKSVILFTPGASGTPIELAFQPQYGSIVGARWFGNGYLAVAFTEGHVAVVSTAAREVQREVLASSQLLGAGVALNALAVSDASSRLAIAGGSLIRFVDARAWREASGEAAKTDPVHGSVRELAWTRDGQILTAATDGGFIYTFLARLPAVAAVSAGRAAYLSSLFELTVCDIAKMAAVTVDAGGDSNGPADLGPGSALVPIPPPGALTFRAPMEPSLIGVGPAHVAVSADSRAFFFRASPGGPPAALVAEKTYPALVDVIVLASAGGHAYAAVIAGGRVRVHGVESDAPLAPMLLDGAGGVFPDSDDGGGGEKTKALGSDDGLTVTAIAAGGDYLFWGATCGAVRALSLRDGIALPGVELRLEAPIRTLVVNAKGTRVLVNDTAGNWVVFLPVTGAAIRVPVSLPSSSGGGARGEFDAIDPNVFLIAADVAGAESDGALAFSFLVAPVTLSGPTVTPLGIASLRTSGETVVEPAGTRLPSRAHVLALIDGVMIAHMPGAGLVGVPLVSHDALAAPRGASRLSPERARARFTQAVALGRLGAALDAAATLGEPAAWRAAAGKAMEVLDVDSAMRAQRALGDAAMVAALRALGTGPEDRGAAAGAMAALFCDWDLAQDLLLASPHARAALDIRADLLEWDAAARLAARVEPRAAPIYQLEIAKTTELRGDARAALNAYNDAATALSAPYPIGAPAPGPAAAPASIAKALAAARAGAARCLFRLGDVRAGAALALELRDPALLRECGALAESLRALSDAAALYAAAGATDAAVRVYLSDGNLTAAGALLSKVVSPRLFGAFARAAEAAGDFTAAASAYERARDADALVRLLIEKLGAATRAQEIVRTSRSREGAALCARAAAARKDIPAAIEFSLLARARDDAFALAVEHDAVETYVTALESALAAAAAGRAFGVGGVLVSASASASKSSSTSHQQASGTTTSSTTIKQFRLPLVERERVGHYYEARGDVLRAARMHGGARALSLLLSCAGAGGAVGSGGVPDEDRARACTDAAIALVGAARSEPLTTQLLAYLSRDGGDARRVLELHLALGAHASAAKTALVIARAEMESAAGSLKAAHSLLFDVSVALTGAGAHVPRDLARTLVLLHSYVLIKKLISSGDAEGAARVLTRVAKNVSRFSGHAPNILQSAVIQCNRGGLKKQGHEFACSLLAGEHKESVREDFRKKIENVVRRPPTEADPLESLSPCPFCEYPVPAYDLNCTACASELPFCIATGRHMTAADCSQCPSCGFPGLLPHLQAIAKSDDPACPLCSAPIAPSALVLILEPVPFLKKIAGMEVVAGGE
jgi:WD repeat-containing protein 19